MTQKCGVKVQLVNYLHRPIQIVQLTKPGCISSTNTEIPSVENTPHLSFKQEPEEQNVKNLQKAYLKAISNNLKFVLSS